MIPSLVPCPFWGRGLSHLHPIILPLVSCPFWGRYSSHRWGYPSPGWGYTRMEYPPARSGLEDWYLPWPGQDGVPPARSGWGTPWPGQHSFTPPLARSGWSTPWPAQDKVCPRLGHYSVPPGRNWITTLW